MRVFLLAVSFFKRIHLKYIKIIIVLASLFLISACGSESEKSATESRSESISGVKSRVEPVSDSLDFTFSCWMAGTDTADTSSSYLKYREVIQSTWKKIIREKVDPIRTFTDSFIPQLRSVRTLVYPFAGGDFLYADAFFPEADTILMFGLEPAGTIFGRDTVSEVARRNYLSELHKSMFYSNELGFFRTLSMEKELQQNLLNGTLHPILFYLVQSGYEILDIQSANLSPDGQIVICENMTCRQAEINRFLYIRKGEARVRELIYFSGDISDAGLKMNPGIQKYLENRDTFHVFLKAASYLLHQAEFSQIRNLLAGHASSVLQDDSGFPLRVLDSMYSDIQVFGTYSRTIPLFSSFYQEDLKQRFQKSSKIRNPGFIIGYNQKFRETNLIFAQKLRPL